MVKKISITGGIGSGKTTVAKILAELGYFVLDADLITAEIIKKKDVETKIKTIFGEQSYLSSGLLNREWMRLRVFSDSTLKDKLETLLHPMIGQNFKDRVEQLNQQGVSCWVFYEASLIFEKNLHSLFDANVLVTADDKVRISRVIKKQNLSEELVQKIIASQMPATEKLKLSDFVLDNSSTCETLEKEVSKLIQFLRKKFKCISLLTNPT